MLSDLPALHLVAKSPRQLRTPRAWRRPPDQNRSAIGRVKQTRDASRSGRDRRSGRGSLRRHRGSCRSFHASLTASVVRIDIGSDGEILPDSIQNLKSAVRTTTPNKSSNPVAGRIRNQRRDLMLHGVGAARFELATSCSQSKKRRNLTTFPSK